MQYRLGHARREPTEDFEQEKQQAASVIAGSIERGNSSSPGGPEEGMVNRVIWNLISGRKVPETYRFRGRKQCGLRAAS